MFSEALRGEEKVGQQLMSKTLETCTHHWPDKPVYLGSRRICKTSTRVSFYPCDGGCYEEDPHAFGMAREVISA